MVASAARDKSKHLVIDLPSGDTLQYYTIRASKKGFEGFTTKGDFGHQSLQPRLWGGTLTENVTQRTARDVLANAIINLEAAGFPVLFHAHDEVILEIDDNPGKEDAIREAEIILKTPPEWAADLPLGTEGSTATAYTK